MKAHLIFLCHVLSVCGSLVIVASCGQSQVEKSSLIPGQLDERIAPGRAAGASWMAPDAKGQSLLYVLNNAPGSVAVYSYPEGKLEGRILDVGAAGLCSDQSGHVFIPETNEIREYLHGDTRPMRVLHNPLGGISQFCAVDPVTGNLAVPLEAYPRLGVAIYSKVTGDAKIYVGDEVNGAYWSCTYDDQGNLFVASTSGGLHLRPTLVELPKGGNRFRIIAWNGKPPDRLSSIQWDGKHIVAESLGSRPGTATLLRYSVSASRATSMGQTTLKGAGSPLQFSIRGGEVIAPSRNSNGASDGVAVYDYPFGGTPATVIKDASEPRAATLSRVSEPKIAVITYHYDNLRTGWDDSESSLSYKNVQSGSFGLLHTVALDDQVDTQPLIVPDETTTRGVQPGKHDVAYVATESNTVYAVDASSGTVLFEQNLGIPVPEPLGCNNNGPNVGINGTPVIDLSANVMYVIAYTLESGTPTYYIHELNLASLTDAVAPVVISASHTLTDGDSFAFNATYQRQRAALLEANGNIYAGFGSFCDFSASLSRGWLIGWQGGTLTPLAANQLNDSLGKSAHSFFLSSIWMSGYGVAEDPSGNLYFVTGNSDPYGKTYNGVTNIQESVVKVSPDLTQLLSIFTPSDVAKLDKGDVDFGSGGVLLLPPLSASYPPLAVAAGKNGTMFLLSQNDLGGYTKGGPNNDLDAKNIGGCWCGESYFDAAKDSVPRIVASGGNYVTLWKVQTSPSPKFVRAGSSQALPGGQDPGFFTSVSSAGSNPGAIIWAVARPQTAPGNVTLFAFESEPPHGQSTLATLYEGTAGYWEASMADADLVPVVANGKVYVASYKQLDIFAVGGTASAKIARATSSQGFAGINRMPHEVTGVLIAIMGSQLTLRTRTGNVARVYDLDAVRHERSADLVVGEPFNARGAYDAARVLHATAIVRAKPSPATWPPDR
jgi:hypothetical protein